MVSSRIYRWSSTVWLERARVGFTQHKSQNGCRVMAERTEQETETWFYTKFLIERLKAGDRVVIQREKPLRTFLLGEVIEPCYEFSPGNLPDFNHVLHVKPLTTEPIAINSKAVTASLKSDLSKRGHYYEIYPVESVHELDAIVKKLEHGTLNYASVRTDEDTFDDTRRGVTDSIFENIARRWKRKDFETFCERICKSVDYVEVKEKSDRGKGWDLLIRIINPITGTILIDDVPVQCKNYSGSVSDYGAIDDLERSIRNSKSPVAYLFILGNLTDGFRAELERRRNSLERERGSLISFELVEQDRIAELYAAFISGYKTAHAATFTL
jgi:Restriction endonuclease